MRTPQPSISGTRDYAGEDAIALQRARDAIAATLRRYSYAAIDPPILESSSPFLNRSGEEIRRQMYIFPDPAGREVCLRPELTIPVCRAYLRQLQSAATENSPPAETRLCYFGPVFTYEPAGEGRYRQSYQAGAELIGAQAREAADAEILAAALDALRTAGLNETSVEIADVDIRNAFIEQLPISERSKTRIRRIALRNQSECAPCRRRRRARRGRRGQCHAIARVRRARFAAGRGRAGQGGAADPGGVCACRRASRRRADAGGDHRATDQPDSPAGRADFGRADRGGRRALEHP